MPPYEDAYINVELPKGCVLRISAAQYAEGIKRGRAYLRANQHAAREQAMIAQHEAERLSFLDEENP